MWSLEVAKTFPCTQSEVKQLHVQFPSDPRTMFCVILNVSEAATKGQTLLVWERFVECISHLSPLNPTGRTSLHGKSSLRIERVRSEDQGWYECKVLMLEQQYHTFHNGSWVHLTVNGESSHISFSWISITKDNPTFSVSVCLWHLVGLHVGLRCLGSRHPNPQTGCSTLTLAHPRSLLVYFTNRQQIYLPPKPTAVNQITLWKSTYGQ